MANKPSGNTTGNLPKANIKHKASTASKPAATKPSDPKGSSTKSTASTSAKGKPWTFPKNTLEDAIAIAKAIEEKNAGNPMPANDIAVAVGFNQSHDWRFLDLLRSANQYGLVTGTGASGYIHLAKLGQDIVAPSSPHQRSEALLGAFRNVNDFESVEKYYGGKRIPEDEFFLNTLTREFNIPRDRADHFAQVFLHNIKYLRAFSAAPQLTESSVTSPDSPSASASAEKVSTHVISKEPRVREFLDTCFVMMPFGEWFDKYYQEIYVPAIKEAGFEPIRADELFTTGSVVEQIWEQIERAKLLLADLSGRNPNVFYELGLAHAAHKPVVFTASQLEEVPFDLRHLRVIIYDVREPEWAAQLRNNVSDYLRNATKDPDKSIPHPFRKSAIDDESKANRPGRRT
jgi:hypothetical protein